MSYESQIIELVAKNPGIRAVQVSDRIDLDLDVVEQILLRLVGAGTVTTSAGQAQNGRRVTEYSIAQNAANGGGKPHQQPAALPPVSQVPPRVEPVATKPAPTPAATKAAPAEKKPKRQYKRKPQGEGSASPAQFRCALWSDGILEIRRGVDDIVLLTQDEQRAILRALASTNLTAAPGCAGG